MDDDEVIATASLEVDVDDNNEAAAAEREHCFRMGVPNGRMSMIASQNVVVYTNTNATAADLISLKLFELNTYGSKIVV